MTKTGKEDIMKKTDSGGNIMDIIRPEELKELTANLHMEGIVLIGSYAVKTAKSGSEYIDGRIQSGYSVKFRAWSSSRAFQKLKDKPLANHVCSISGRVDEYQGNCSVIIDDVQEVEGYSIGQFMPELYNTEEWFLSLQENSCRMLSEKGRETLDRLLYQNEALVSRLKEEFAAMSHHDNCKGGLLAHTVKMVDFLPIVLDNYPVLFSDKDDSGQLKESPDKRDLLVIGCILHDIGKTREMDYGVYQKGSFVSHRFFGAEMVEEHKDYIVGQYGEEWFYHLIAILLQHHDQFGDPCRDVYALIVHKIDDIESSLTNLSQEIEQNGNADPSGQFIWYDNKTLYY